MNMFKDIGLRMKAAVQSLVGTYKPYRLFARQLQSLSGEVVTPQTALRVSALFACLKVITEDVSTLPLLLYRVSKDHKGKERAWDEGLYELLHLRPNPEMSSVTWRETVMLHSLLWGRHYSEIVRAPSGKVLSIWPIPNPEWVSFRRQDDGTPYYYVSVPGASPVSVPYENILHVKGLTLDGYLGLEMLTVAREVIGLALAAQNYTAAYFRNGAEPSAVIKYPKSLSDEAYDRLTKSCARQASGEKRHGLLVLEDGAEWIKTSFSPADSQLAEMRKNDVLEICRFFRVPPHKVAALERATNNNIEQQDLDYYKSTLRPWLVKIEQELTIRLLTPGSGLAIEFLIDGLLRGDYKSRMDGYALGIQNGIFSPNECRAMENLNPRPGGDVYFQPLNMASVGTQKEDA